MSTPDTQPTTQSSPPPPRFRGRLAWSLGGLVLIGGVCIAWAMAVDQPAAVQGYEVVQIYPHDAGAFSQGLVIENGDLYEGTGLYGESTLRQVDLKTGKVLKDYKLNPQVFGEGIAFVDDTIVQLTWRRQIAIVYDRKTLKPQRSFPYRGEGWGLTYDGTHLIMSDGTSRLRFLNPKTFRVVKRLRVSDGDREINRLNELEYVGGEIFANVWHSDRVARISPKTGEVLGWIDLSGLLKPGEVDNEEAVLNGIAYDAKTKKLYVTGKNWPKLFEIRLTKNR